MPGGGFSSPGQSSSSRGIKTSTNSGAGKELFGKDKAVCVVHPAQLKGDGEQGGNLGIRNSGLSLFSFCSSRSTS